MGFSGGGGQSAFAQSTVFFSIFGGLILKSIFGIEKYQWHAALCCFLTLPVYEPVVCTPRWLLEEACCQ